MHLEVVKFGNGKAIEIRDANSKSILFLHFVGVLGLSRKITRISDVNIHAFTNECIEVIKGGTEYQWLLFCSDIEVFGDPQSIAVFDGLYKSTFGGLVERSPLETDEDEIIRAGNSDSNKLKPRCWLLNQKTDQIYCVHFDFGNPIYCGSVLEGMVLPSGGDGAEYHIKKVNHWCGGNHTLATSSKTFIRQQLNVWFYSGDWFKPTANDAFKFYVDVVDEDTPRGLTTDQASLPILDGKTLEEWKNHHRIHEVRIFRLHKTQYPFVYSLMPDVPNDGGINTSILATVLTAESQLIIFDAFSKAGKKTQYLRWQCARYAPESHAGVWIPYKMLS